MNVNFQIYMSELFISTWVFNIGWGIGSRGSAGKFTVTKRTNKQLAFKAY